MKSAARTSLKIFSIISIFASLVYLVLTFVLFKPDFNNIVTIVEVAEMGAMLLLSIFILLALGLDSRGFMIAVGVVGCIIVVGIPYSIILFCIAHYEFEYYY